MYRDYNFDMFNNENIDDSLIDLDDYILAYNVLVARIVDNSDDIFVIKDCIEKLAVSFKDLVELDFFRLFEIFNNQAPMASVVALNNELFLKQISLPTDYREKILEDSENDFDNDFDFMEDLDENDEELKEFTFEFTFENCTFNIQL